jgi:hypothetical protein
VSRLALEHEKRLRDLCRRAACETDVDKLLMLFLELDRTAERGQQRVFLARPLEATGRPPVQERWKAQ